MRVQPWLLLSWIGACSFALAAAEWRVSNRAPKPDEVGYRPADGSTVQLNPPSWIWLHETNALSYDVQWSRDTGFGDAVTVEGFRWNTYTHHEPLKPGTYHWRYRFAGKDGLKSGWSLARSVTVPAEAIAFPMPTVAQQRERIPQQHPRLFLRPEDLPRLRELARGQEADRFRRLQAEADRILAAGPTAEPTHRGSARNKEDQEAVRYWWPNRTQTEKACLEAETLAFVYLLTQDPKYGEGARRWVLHLAAWDPDGPTNFGLNCEAAKPMLFRPARAYDWAWDRFTADEREKLRAITSRRVTDAWNSGEVQRGVGHLNRPFNSHGNRVWHKIAEPGIVFLDEIPQAEMWLDYAVNKFYACYPVWSDDDGGWHEGVSYWSGYLSKTVWWLQIAQSALGIDGLRKPFFAHVGDYPLYIAPPHSPNMGLGDLSHRPPNAPAFLEYFIRVKGSQPDGAQAGYWRWWYEQLDAKGSGGILGFLYAASLPPLPPAKAPTDLPTSRVFRGIGVASLHTTLLDSREDVHFLFKSSPFGTQSHGHNPHNSFQLNAYGEALLTTCVYRDLHGSKFHYEWAHSTVAHNGVLVDGVGQIKHTAAPHGRIADFQLAKEWDYVVGEARDAYAERLDRYRRHVVFVKGNQPFLVLYDDLAAREPSTFQFLLHALAEFRVDPERAHLSVAQPRAGVSVRYLSPLPLSFRQWDGYQPPPDPEKKIPNQWHVEASTQSKERGIGMLTVILPHRSGGLAEWSLERIQTDTAVGVRVSGRGQITVIGFREAAAVGPAELAGIEFETPFLVRRIR